MKREELQKLMEETIRSSTERVIHLADLAYLAAANPDLYWEYRERRRLSLEGRDDG